MAFQTWKLAAAAAVGVAAATAKAGLLPTSSTSTPDGTTNRYDYGVVLTSDSKLQPGDYFTVFNFDGFVPGSNTQPADFTFSASKGGGTPTGIAGPAADANGVNLTWTYTGTGATGQLPIGDFTAASTNASTALSQGGFAGQTHRSADGQIDSNVTTTIIPGTDPITTPIPVDPTVTAGGDPTDAPPGVPEPATLVLLAAGLPLAGVARFVRGRGKV